MLSGTGDGDTTSCATLDEGARRPRPHRWRRSFAGGRQIVMPYDCRGRWRRGLRWSRASSTCRAELLEAAAWR